MVILIQRTLTRTSLAGSAIGNNGKGKEKAGWQSEDKAEKEDIVITSYPCPLLKLQWKCVVRAFLSVSLAMNPMLAFRR